MKKFFIGLLVIIAGGVFGWYYFRENISTTLPEPFKISPTVMDKGIISNVNVVYSDSGFAPKFITAKKGTTVTFTNQSSGKMWVASDMHPTHQLLPGFDQFGGEAKGATYQYVFTKVGTWTYHNHVNPSMSGTVTVME